jgi:hypothetical protein
MSDGITEARRGTYFSDRNKLTGLPAGDNFANADLTLTGVRDHDKGSIEIDGQKIPNPKAHQRISFAKSSIRIIGYSFIPFNLEIACAVLIFSEIIGIIEELV